MTVRFDDKVAVVTGAGAGLGKNYALFLAARGAKVVVNDLGTSWQGEGQSAAPAQQVVDEILAAGGQAVANFDSVSDRAGAENIIATAMDQYGKVDILINNAGILRDKSFAKMTLDDFELVLNVHLLGSVYVTKAAFGPMKSNGYGRIVLTTSGSGLYGNFGQTNYCAAKLGLIGFMNALKLEGGKYDIRVNAIAPLAVTRLSDPSGVFGKSSKQQLGTGPVTAMVALMCSAQYPGSGDIISAGGGYFAKAQMMEGPGVRIDLEHEITPELLLERHGEIVAMDPAEGFENLGHQIKDRLGLEF